MLLQSCGLPRGLRAGGFGSCALAKDLRHARAPGTKPAYSSCLQQLAGFCSLQKRVSGGLSHLLQGRSLLNPGCKLQNLRAGSRGRYLLGDGGRGKLIRNLTSSASLKSLQFAEGTVCQLERPFFGAHGSHNTRRYTQDSTVCRGTGVLGKARAHTYL